MTVTEFAILHVKSGELGSEMLAAVKHSLDIQNEWQAANYPHLPNTLVERASLVLQQIEDPARLLVTAEWESVETHFHWIGSEENANVMSTIGHYLAEDIETELDLSHIDGTTFDRALLDSPIISVDRFFVDLGAKDEFNSKLEEVANVMEETHQAVRGGWRVDVEPGKRQEYALVSSWDSTEKHSEFISQHSFLFAQIKNIAAETKTKHYRRVV